LAGKASIDVARLTSQYCAGETIIGGKGVVQVIADITA
jgi:hypothetical protein